MTSIIEIQTQLTSKRLELKKVEDMRMSCLTKGVSEFTIQNGDDKRSAKILSFSELNNLIRQLRLEIAELESQLALGGKRVRGTVIGGIL